MQIYLDGVAEYSVTHTDITDLVKPYTGFTIGVKTTGQGQTPVEFYTGDIFSLKITDLTVPTNSISWNLESGSTRSEPSVEFPGDPTKDLIYTNVSPSDWS